MLIKQRHPLEGRRRVGNESQLVMVLPTQRLSHSLDGAEQSEVRCLVLLRHLSRCVSRKAMMGVTDHRDACHRATIDPLEGPPLPISTSFSSLPYGSDSTRG